MGISARKPAHDGVTCMQKSGRPDEVVDRSIAPAPPGLSTVGDSAYRRQDNRSVLPRWRAHTARISNSRAAACEGLSQ
jgi:hypothetical protein